ncbi:MAG: short-chain dehydrogenase/reductase [Pseudomonadota bacterium]
MKTLDLMRRLLRPTTQDLDVAGKVVLITGGADGIGLETARCLKARGALLVIIDRNEAAAHHAVALLGEQNVLAITADVTDRAAMRDAIEQTLAHFGRLDVVVANAGITPPPATIRTCNLDDFDRVIAVNLTGVLNTVHPAIEALIKQQGHIVVVASCAAFCPPVGGASYMVSKAAVEQLGRGLKLELAPHGVSVTISYFGLVDTQLARATLDDDPMGSAMKQQLPALLRKRISPQQAGEVIANAIKTRAEHSMAPMAWESLSLLRGLVNPVLDRYLVGDPHVHDVLRELEARKNI